ncbi:MAG: exodeoxyribonuclease subunit alpha, partial [Pseudomonadota bacterium]
ACALAARRSFAIITGGPGTGKTTTVVRLLAVLQALALAGGKAASPLRIRLAAPTGKAAARLNAAIARAVAGLKLEALADGERIRQAIPLQVSTLHRLLGSRPDSRRFRHHGGNPLPLDVLVIDEASMVDLEMMAAVLDALPATARLILLGDKDQLASVEAGAVLGELCRRAERGHYTRETRDWLQEASGTGLPEDLLDTEGQPLDQAVVMLRHSHRFGAGSGIGQLAAAVNAGDLTALRPILATPRPDLARWRRGLEGEAALERLLLAGCLATNGVESAGAAGLVRQGYRHYLTVMRAQRPVASAPAAALDLWAGAVLEAHGEFQLLCALRRGPWGVEGLNQRVAGLLFRAGLIPATEGWYPGRPVLVTRNDYGLGLMNGDIGITLALPRPDGGGDSLRVAFPAADGQGIHWVQPSRLQAVETVYALTVHKSQGSEFRHAALLLPEQLNPILTRELIYTGITRAREAFTLLETGQPQVLEQGVMRRVLRGGGALRPD